MGTVAPLPYYGQLPAGYQLPVTASASASATGTVSTAGTVTPDASADSVSVPVTLPPAQITADSGDLLSVSSLFSVTPPSGGAIEAYRVALRGDPSGAAGGKLMLGTADVTGQTSFTADQFAQLHYVVGPDGGSQDLVVLAQTGTLDSAGHLSNTVDSQAVQLTVAATGQRSVSAAGALLSSTLGSQDAAFVGVAEQASIFIGTGPGSQPTLSTAGNATADAGDLLSVSSLFTASAPTVGGSIGGYQVALRDDDPAHPGGGRLMLGTTDVTGQTSFTADQFAQLHYVAGSGGSAQDLVVVAQTGTADSAGTLRNVTDSAAVAITLSATGQRSINAAGALLSSTVGSPDAAFVGVAQEAAIFTGTGSGSRPTLSTVGNVTSDAGDLLSVSNLYSTTAPTGGTVAGYRVALRDEDPSDPGGGRLMLGTTDVTGQTSFTADQFAQLHYVAGSSGSAQDLVVVAQTGTTDSDGTLHNVTDSAAVAITLSATGQRSINGAGALLSSTLGSPDAAFVGVAQQASIFAGTGPGSQPTLSTVGNATTDAGDLLSVSSLFTATAPTAGGSVGGYQVALRDDDPAHPGGGKLMLGTTDVTGQTSFTADQFAQLHYVAGSGGSAQDVVVVAQTGTADSSGTLRNVTDSAAVAITLSTTGQRSINAAGALLTSTAGSPDSGYLGVVQQASIFTGASAAARPTLATAGNLTAAAGDLLSVGSLFTATAPSGSSIGGYQVALRDDDPSNPGGGRLMLGATDVTGQTSFTTDQFAQLHYVAGNSDGRQSLVVVAQTGTADNAGTLRNVTDSAAVAITFSATGQRSLNEAGALLSSDIGGTDASFVSVAQEASIFIGTGAASRPTMTARAAAPVANVESSGLGAFQATGATVATSTQYDPLQANAGVGGSVTSGPPSPEQTDLDIAAMLLSGTAVGAFQTAGGISANAQVAVLAYQASQRG